MKNIITLLLGILISWGAAAQMLPHHEGTCLSWDDFQVRDASEDGSSSQLIVHWDQKNLKKKVGKYRVHYSLFSVEPRSDLSWVLEDCRTPEELAVNQTLYDMAESFANAMTDSCLFSPAKTEEVLEHFYQAYLEAAKTFRETGQTTFPYPEDKVWDLDDLKWERLAKDLFFGLGVTNIHILGPGKDLISPSKGFQLDIGRRIGESALILDATYGSSDKPYLYNEWEGSSSKGAIPHYSVSLQYAYILPRIGDLQISPFAGAGYSRYGLRDNYSLTDARIMGATLSEGISVGYFPIHNLRLKGHGPRLSEYGLYLKLYSEQMYLATQKLIMPSINLTAGLAFTSGIFPRPSR